MNFSCSTLLPILGLSICTILYFSFILLCTHLSGLSLSSKMRLTTRQWPKELLAPTPLCYGPSPSSFLQPQLQFFMGVEKAGQAGGSLNVFQARLWLKPSETVSWSPVPQNHPQLGSSSAGVYLCVASCQHFTQGPLRNTPPLSWLNPSVLDSIREAILWKSSSARQTNKQPNLASRVLGQAAVTDWKPDDTQHSKT